MKTHILFICLKVLVRKPCDNTYITYVWFSGDGRPFSSSPPPRDSAPGRKTYENTAIPDIVGTSARKPHENTYITDMFNGFGKEYRGKYRNLFLVLVETVFGCLPVSVFQLRRKVWTFKRGNGQDVVSHYP